MNSKEDLKNEIMPKFDTIYEEIMNDVNKSLPNAFDINTISELSTPRYRWFNTYELLNEYVEDNDKSLRRSKTLPGNGYGIYMKNKEFFDNMFQNSIDNNILEFINYIVKNKEQDTSIKHILMGFQREYERHNKERSPYKEDEDNNRKNLNQRLMWLEYVLDHTDFNSKEWSSKLQLIRKNWKELNDGARQDYDFAYALIGYFIYKNILPGRQIDEKLNQHFKTFKYRDN